MRDDQRANNMRPHARTRLRLCSSAAVLLASAIMAPPLAGTANATGACTPTNSAASPDGLPSTSHFARRDLVEASGIERSRTLDGAVWVHNDSGGDASIFATDATGENLGRLLLTDLEPWDWEDITGATIDGEPHLIVGDIGDNNASRDDARIHVLAEPDLACLSPGFAVELTEFTTVQLTYGDQSSHNAESMAFDRATGELLVVTKEDSATDQQTLFTGLLADGMSTGTLTLEPQTTLGGFADQPGYSRSATGMDVSPDGNRLALVTYGLLFTGHVEIWDRAEGQSWAAALSRPADHEFDVPSMEGNLQAEGIAWDPTGERLLVVAESPGGPTSTVTSLPAPGRSDAPTPGDAPSPEASTTEDPSPDDRGPAMNPETVYGIAGGAVVLVILVLIVRAWRAARVSRR